MRWLFAAFAFALLVALAIATVAIKVTNVHQRRRLESFASAHVAQSVEFARCREELRADTSRAALAMRWRGWLRRAQPQN